MAGLPLLMTDGMVRRLGRSAGLHVIPPQEGQLPGAVTVKPEYVLKSMIQQEADGVHAEYSLVRTESSQTVWNAGYSEDGMQVDVIIEEASSAVLTSVGQPLAVPSAPLLPSGGDARKMYLEGMAHFARGDRNETNLAVERFKSVIRMDSTFIPAYLRLAESYLEIVDNGWDRNLVWQTLAREACRKAAQIDPDAAEAQALLGETILRYGDNKQAEALFRKALKLNSSLDDAWGGMGKILSGYGLYNQSLDAYEKALAIRPSNMEYGINRAMILIGLKRYSEAEEQLGILLRYHPEDARISLYTGLVKYYLGDTGTAEKKIKEALEAESLKPLCHAFLGMVYAKEGRLDEAMAEVELEVKPYTGRNASLATSVAAIYALLQRNGLAMEWLGNARTYGYSEYPWLLYDPNFDGLRNDSRFIAYMENLKQVWETRRSSYTEGYSGN